MASLGNPGSYLILISSAFVVGTALYTVRIDRSWRTLVYGSLLLIGIVFIVLSISDIRIAIGLEAPLQNILTRPPTISKVGLSGTLFCMTGAMFFLWLSHRASQ